MGLRGRAVLAIWHDIREGDEDEFNHWHTKEHMPERVLTPGMLVGRRYADYGSSEFRYFTLYEAESLDVFGSEGYFATANSPSPWTVKAQKAFYNFARQPCHIIMTRGSGIGGALATIRITLPARAEAQRDADELSPADAFNTAARKFAEGAMAMECVTGAHVVVAGKIERVPARKAAIQRRAGNITFDGLIMVEALGRPQLERAIKHIEELVAGEKACIASHVLGVYDLAYYLAKESC